MNPSECQEFIQLIRKSLKNSISNSFDLICSKSDALSYVVAGTSSALNRFQNSEKVNVIQWFDHFWLFLKITFMKEEQNVSKQNEFRINTISLSVFQGKDADEDKYQLFRAEWDDYNKPDEKHAQPHWHITSSQAIEKTLVKCTENFDEDDFGQQFFLQTLEDEKQKVFDVKKIHFAMNADWQSNESHVHKTEKPQQIVNWLQGMLYYLREELTN